MQQVVVVGASAAGLAAVETLRREGFTGRITVVGEEDSAPYDRPPLSKQVLQGSWEPDRVALRKPAALEALDATWRHGVAATGLDPAARRVTLADGSTLDYDGLVIATGVTPRRLPGDELAGVQVLRTLDDALALKAALQPGARLLVIGAGFLGSEVAAVAREAGLPVTLVDPLPAPMVRQLGPVIAAQVATLHRSRGVDLRCGVGVRRLTSAAGQVTGADLDDGSHVEADVVLVAIGSHPNTGWLAGSGLSLTNGVDCDEFCRAGKDIVAAGDVASWQHLGLGRRVRIEHRTNAAEQGAAAARTLLGLAAAPFAPVPYFWSDQYDVKIQVHGSPTSEAECVLVRGEVADGRFAVAYRQAGRSVAMLTWNLPRAALELRAELLAELPVLS